MAYFPEGITPESIQAQWLPKLDKNLGVKVTEVRSDSLHAELYVGEELMQPFGVMHGGVSCVLGESLGSVAGGMCLNDSKKTVVGQSLYAMHLRPVKAGMTLKIVASPVHIGKRSHIWEIKLSDQASGKATAKVTLTLAVIDLP